MHGCPQHDNTSMNHDRHCSAGDRVSKYYAAGNITFFREQETESLYTAQREDTHMRRVDAIGNRSHQPQLWRMRFAIIVRLLAFTVPPPACMYACR